MNYYLNPKVSKITDATIRFLNASTGKSISSITNEMLEDAINLPKYQRLIDASLVKMDAKLKEKKRQQLAQKMNELYNEYISI
jgi:hypothetical protein